MDRKNKKEMNDATAISQRWRNGKNIFAGKKGPQSKTQECASNADVVYPFLDHSHAANKNIPPERDRLRWDRAF